MIKRWRNKHVKEILLATILLIALSSVSFSALVLAAPGGTGGNSTSTPSSSTTTRQNTNTQPGTGGNSSSVNTNTSNRSNSQQSNPSTSQQNDNSGGKGCYTDDYKVVANYDQAACQNSGYNWVSGFDNVGNGCKDNSGCKKAVDKQRRERQIKETQNTINSRKKELAEICSATSKASDCWNYDGNGKLYTSTSGNGSGTWNTLKQRYDDCRVTTNENMGDSLSKADKTLASYAGKNFRCKKTGTDNWYQCSIKTTTANETTKHFEFVCPTDDEINDGTAKAMTDEQISDMDKQNESDFNGDSDDDTCEQSLFGLGWVLCPLKELIVGGIDGFMNWITTKLDAKVLIGDTGAAIKTVAQKFVAYGNIILTIVFIIMIYSMATSTGLSNYEIKKTMPRLVIVAIAINLSFYICAALVDISNIAGHGMYSLMCGAGDCTNMQNQTTVLGITNIIGTGIVSMLMAILSIVLFGGAVIVSFLVIIVCIEFREIALAVMTIIAPVAIALYLLPNTQKWAEKWFSLYTQLLLVYPLFTGMLGGVQLIGNLLMQGNDTNPTGIPNFLIALGCDIVPAIAIVPLFQASGTLMGKVAGLTQKYTAPIGDAGAKLTRNNAVTRGIAKGVSVPAGAVARKFGGRGFVGRNAARLQSSATTFAGSKKAEEVGFQAKLAEAAETSVSNMDDDELRQVFTTGKYKNGKDADRYVLAAAASSYKDKATEDDWRQATAMARRRANELKSKKNDAEGADKLLDSFSSAAKNGSAFYGSTKGFADLSSNWDYDQSVAARGASVSASDVAGMSESELDSVASAVMNSGNTSAVSNLQHASAGALNDQDLRSQMSYNQQSKLNSIAGGSVFTTSQAVAQQTQQQPRNGNARYTTIGEAQDAGRELQASYQKVNRNIVQNVVQDGKDQGRYANTADVQALAEAENRMYDLHQNAQAGSDAENEAIRSERAADTRYR